MDAATISALISVAVAVGASTVVAILTYWYQRQSKEVRETTSRTALDLKTVILADEEESKRILFRIEDYLQSMRSFQESLEKPLQQERQEIRALSKSLTATAKEYNDILIQLREDFPDLRYFISDQSKRMEQILNQLFQTFDTDLKVATKQNLTSFHVLSDDIQKLGVYLQKFNLANQSISTTLDSSDTIPSEFVNELTINLRTLTVDLSNILSLLNQSIQQLDDSRKAQEAYAAITISTLQDKIKDLVDNSSRDLSASGQIIPQFPEPSKSYEITAVDKLLIYQQVSNVYVHNITTPLVSIESAIVNIKDRLPLLLQTSNALPSESASILMSSLENASFSVESIKSILRQGAGLLADNAQRFSIDALIRKATRMVTTAVPDRDTPTLTLDNLPEVKYHPTTLLIALVQVLGNAYEAAGPDGKINISGKYDASTKKIEIVISNDGETIKPEVLHKIFEPGFSTKGPGHGLGLAIARRHLEAEHGEIDLVSSEDKLTTFKISFKPEEVYQLKL